MRRAMLVKRAQLVLTAQRKAEAAAEFAAQAQRDLAAEMAATAAMITAEQRQELVSALTE